MRQSSSLKTASPISIVQVILYPFITFWLECVATTLKGVVATHSNQKVIKGYSRHILLIIPGLFSQISFAVCKLRKNGFSSCELSTISLSTTLGIDNYHRKLKIFTTGALYSEKRLSGSIK